MKVKSYDQFNTSAEVVALKAELALARDEIERLRREIDALKAAQPAT